MTKIMLTRKSVNAPKLTPKQRAWIQKRLAAGESKSDIAKRYKVSGGTIAYYAGRSTSGHRNGDTQTQRTKVSVEVSPIVAELIEHRWSELTLAEKIRALGAIR